MSVLLPSAGVIGFPPKCCGIHRSSQMRVVTPLPILLINPDFKASFPARIARQVQLAFFFLEHSIKSES
jgi:hypothetical protein